MSYSEFKTISPVLQEFQVRYSEADFIEPLSFSVTDYFRADLNLMMREGVVDNSEFAICENLIYPVLKEVWKQYRQHFILWSHQALTFDNKLSGFPEYILARRSPLGKVVFDKPYLLLCTARLAKTLDSSSRHSSSPCFLAAADRLHGERQPQSLRPQIPCGRPVLQRRLPDIPHIPANQK